MIFSVFYDFFFSKGGSDFGHRKDLLLLPFSDRRDNDLRATYISLPAVDDITGGEGDKREGLKDERVLYLYSKLFSFVAADRKEMFSIVPRNEAPG